LPLGGGERERWRVVERDRRVCRNCGRKIMWADWKPIAGDPSAEVRTGRCACPGKTRLQTRRRPIDE